MIVLLAVHVISLLGWGLPVRQMPLVFKAEIREFNGDFKKLPPPVIKLILFICIIDSYVSLSELDLYTGVEKQWYLTTNFQTPCMTTIHGFISLV